MASKPGAAASGARRTHVFASLCGLAFLTNFGRVAFAPLLEPFMGTFGVGEATAGLVATLAWLGSALPRLPTGYLLTRVRRHRVVLSVGGFLVVAASFTALAPGILLVGVGAFLVGVASGVYYIAGNPLISELFPERVGRALGVHGTAAQLAAVGAPLSIGALLAVASWRLVFWGLAGGAVLVTVGLVVAADGADMPTAGADDRHLLRAIRVQWRIVGVGVLALATTGFVWNGLFNFYVSYLTATKGVGSATANLLLTATFAAGLPAFWITGRLMDSRSHVRVLLAVVAGFTAGVLALTAASGLLALVAVSLVLGYAIHSLFPAVDTYLLSTLPDHNRASAYAGYSATMMGVQATGSVVLGTLVEAGVPYDAVFRVFGVALVGVLAALLVLYRVGRLPGGAVA